MKSGRDAWIDHIEMLIDIGACKDWRITHEK